MMKNKKSDMNFHRKIGNDGNRTGSQRGVSESQCISKRRNFNEGAQEWSERDSGWTFLRPVNLKLALDLIVFLLCSVNLFWHSEPRGGDKPCLLKIIIMKSWKWLLLTELREKISQHAAVFDLEMQRSPRTLWESGRTLSWLDWHPPTPVDAF